MMEAMDSEEIAPSKGLATSTQTFSSSPEGNEVKIQSLRRETARSIADFCQTV